MLSYSGKVMRQFTRFPTTLRMQFGSVTNMKNEKLTNLPTSLHKVDTDKQFKHVSFQPYSTMSPSTSSTVLIKPPVVTKPKGGTQKTVLNEQQQEKLRLKQERERLLEIRTESNARFKDYLDNLPQLDFPKHYKVECATSLEDTNRKLSELLGKNPHRVFGVDLEWPPCFIKGQSENKVTLVQICSESRILLIQLPRIQGGFPLELRRFFEDKNILKSGVNIAADGQKLYRDFGFITNGLVELRDLAEMAITPKLAISHLRSLRALTGIFLDQNMAKGKVRLSNWGKLTLTPLQIRYAALDAYASYKLYVELDKLKDTSKKLQIRHLINEIQPTPTQKNKNGNTKTDKKMKKKVVNTSSSQYF
ncbi:ribonuclease H-like domain-containing protein [Pilaira anomala]|nr:ribonuclease H-like domain-containing protein [Pilaira anomala]